MYILEQNINETLKQTQKTCKLYPDFDSKF